MPDTRLGAENTVVSQYSPKGVAALLEKTDYLGAHKDQHRIIT